MAGLAVNTCFSYRQTMRAFLGDTDVREALTGVDGAIDFTRFDRLTVERWLKKKAISGHAPSTVALYLVALRAFCRYLVGHGRLPSNPLAEMRGPRRYQTESRPLSTTEVRQLFWGTPEKPLSAPVDGRELIDHVQFTVQYAGALRSSEVRALRTDDVIWHEEERCYSVLLSRAKWARSDQRQLLDQETSRMLGAYLLERPRLGDGPYLFPGPTGPDFQQSTNFYSARWRRFCKVRGVEPRGRKLTSHLLRHSAATHMLAAGWPIRAVQDRLRHKSLAATQVYLHTSDRQIARLLVKRPPLRPRAAKKRPDIPGALRSLLDGVRELT